MSEIIKVKVTNSCTKEAWYKDLIGEEIEVIEEYSDVYHLAEDIIEGATYRRYIEKSDCVVINPKGE